MEIDMKALAKLLDAIPGPNTGDKIKKAIDLMAAGDAPAPDAAPKADASAKPGAPVAASTDAPAVALGDAPPMVPAADAPPMPMADPMPDADNDAAVDDFDARMMEALGISDADQYAALLNQFFDAIKATLAGSGDAASVAMSRDIMVQSLTGRVEALTKELNTLKGENLARDAASAAAEVDALVTSGRISPAQKEQAVALARKSPAEFRAMAKMLAPSNDSLTRPHAAALARTTPTDTVTEKDPRVIEATNRLVAMGLKGDALASATKRVIASFNPIAG
jgi:hypothetical protein